MTIEEQANLLFENVAGWETRSLERIGRRIKKYGKMSAADIKTINNAAVAKGEMDAIMKDLAKVTGQNISQLKEIYAQSLEEQHLANKPLYDFRGKKFESVLENKEMRSLIESVARTTAGDMINLSRTKALCIFDSVTGKTTGLEKAIYNSLDKAAIAVSTGTEDFNTAMRDTIKELGGSGIRVNYGNGVTRQLDSVVRQNLLWSTKQINTAYYEKIGEELGCDGVEIDYHSNPRPSHIFLQGRQFHVGKSVTINGEFFQGTEEPDPESPDRLTPDQALNDYGCLHYKTPIMCGISVPSYDKEELKNLKKKDEEPIEIDGVSKTGYEWKQAMRRLESESRKLKTERAMYKASGNEKEAEKYDKLIKAYRQKYNQIAEKTGIRAQPEKMAIVKGSWNDTPKSITDQNSDVNNPTKLPTKIQVQETHEKIQTTQSKSKEFEQLKHYAEYEKIEYNAPEQMKEQITESQIIEKVSGGDMTKGSCSSAALSYIANKDGLDVRDFRGGSSCNMFAKVMNIKDIARLNGVKSKIISDSNDFSAAKKLLITVEDGKEYYFSCGAHAAIIRKTNGRFEYLELQSGTDSGFKQLTTYELKNRFGCKKSHSVAGIKMETSSVLIDADSLKNNAEFKEIVGYINTSQGKEKKGVYGFAK